MQDCYYTDYVGTWDSEWTFTCSSGYAVNGMNSYHHNTKRDTQSRLPQWQGCWDDQAKQDRRNEETLVNFMAANRGK